MDGKYDAGPRTFVSVVIRAPGCRDVVDTTNGHPDVRHDAGRSPRSAGPALRNPRPARSGSGPCRLGAPNVSQMLNLGSLECDRGHAEAALPAADAAGELGLSAYGRAVRAMIRHCVAHQLGDQDAAASQLEVLAELT